MDGSDEQWRTGFGAGRPDKDRLLKMVDEVQQGVRSDAARLGMFCLSAKNDDILMWSHYADHHRGVCLGFSTRAGSIYEDAQPVKYSDAYPSFNYFDTTAEERARLILLTKAAHWAYEEEWRVFRSTGHGLESLPVGTLLRVVVGSEAPSTTHADILKWAVTADYPVRVYQAHRHPEAFRLIIKEVDAKG